jgi:hypothetical protein
LADKDLTLATEDRLVFKAIVTNQVLTEERFKKIYDGLAFNSPKILLAELHELVPEFAWQKSVWGIAL